MPDSSQPEKVWWLYIRGLDIYQIAAITKQEDALVQDIICTLMSGKRPIPKEGPWMNSMDRTDWTLREEYALRFMRRCNLPVLDAAQLLCRGPDQVKRKWKEMKERDVWLHEYARAHRLDLPEPSRDPSGGIEQKQTKRQGFF